MRAQQVIATAVLVTACCVLMGDGLAFAAPPGKACPVTSPNGSTPPGEKPGGHHGNGALWTVLPTDGKVIIRPGVSGSIQPAGSLAMKFPWWRAVRGRLTIQGRRLDAKAPPLRVSIPEGYGDSGFQATGLIFPTEGCWEVTGKAGEASLTFVTDVVRAQGLH
jgi:hypothetical protein